MYIQDLLGDFFWDLLGEGCLLTFALFVVSIRKVKGHNSN